MHCVKWQAKVSLLEELVPFPKPEMVWHRAEGPRVPRRHYTQVHVMAKRNELQCLRHQDRERLHFS